MDSRIEKDNIQQILSATGGFKMLGTLQRMLYGRILKGNTVLYWDSLRIISALDVVIDDHVTKMNATLNSLTDATQLRAKPSPEFFNALSNLKMPSTCLSNAQLCQSFGQHVKKMIEKYFTAKKYQVVLPKKLLTTIASILQANPRSTAVADLLGPELPRENLRQIKRDLSESYETLLSEFTWKIADKELEKFGSEMMKLDPKASQFLSSFKFYLVYIQMQLEKIFGQQELKLAPPKNITFRSFFLKSLSKQLSSPSSTINEKFIGKAIKAATKYAVPKMQQRVWKRISQQIEKFELPNDPLQSSFDMYKDILQKNKKTQVGAEVQKQDAKDLFVHLKNLKSTLQQQNEEVD